MEFLEFYTKNSNSPVVKLNKKIIKSRGLQNKHLEIEDQENTGWSYLYMYIGERFSKEQIETKIDLEKLQSVLVGDYLLTDEAKLIRQNSTLTPLKVRNIDSLVLERAQGLYLLSYFEELYNAVHPRKSNKNKQEATKKVRKRSFSIFGKEKA